MHEFPNESFSNLCRLCGEVDRVCLNLFDNLAQGGEILSRIEKFVRISISQDDGLPTNICSECNKKLSEYFLFYQNCHDTQQRLQEFISIESAIHKTSPSKQPAMDENDVITEVFVYENSEGSNLDGSFPEEENQNYETVHAEEDVSQGQEQQGEEEVCFPKQEESDTFSASQVYFALDDEEVEVKGCMDKDMNTQEVLLMSDSEWSCKNLQEKLIYLVTDTADLSLQSVLSPSLRLAESEILSRDSVKKEENSLPLPKKISLLTEAGKGLRDLSSQKVVIKGSDGKETLVFVDVPLEKCFKTESSEDIDDPSWTPCTDEDSVSTVQAATQRSALKRARNAVRNSVKRLRLPKPKKGKEKSQDLLHRNTVPKHIITKDDPNYAIMMEKFAKPVTLSTLKRHGLYQPRPNSYKINAPYKKDVAPYIEKVSDTEYKCKICLSAKFRWNYKAEIHILEHLDWRPFECDVCGRAFTQNQYLRKHKRLHFPEDNHFICEVCGKGFQRRYYLTYHMDEHFDRTYTCEECGRKFSLRQKHDEHVRYHHKCNYTICDICGQTVRTTALSRHKKHHNEDNQPRKRKQKTANSSASQMSWVLCKVCGKAFRSSSTRDIHEEEHHNSQLPFQCTDCNVYFKTKRSLTDHTLHAHRIMEEDETQVASRVLDELGTEAFVSIKEAT